MTYLFVPVLNSYDRVAYIQMANILSALSNLLIDTILIKRIGIIGAALGTFSAYFIKSFLLIIAINKMFAVQNKKLHAICFLLSAFIIGYFLIHVY